MRLQPSAAIVASFLAIALPTGSAPGGEPGTPRGPIDLTCPDGGLPEGELFHLGTDPSCDTVEIVESVMPPAGEPAEIFVTVPSDAATWWFVAPSSFEGVPCQPGGTSGNDSLLAFSCAPPEPPGPCPQLGDANSDGVIDFGDLLIVLANFGDCP